MALKVAYLGWDYQGFVVQEETERTIEAVLFDALLKTRLIESRSDKCSIACLSVLFGIILEAWVFNSSNSDSIFLFRFFYSLLKVSIFIPICTIKTELFNTSHFVESFKHSISQCFLVAEVLLD